MCVSGRRQHFIFPANSCGLTKPMHPSHQEFVPAARTVGWPFCYLTVVILVLSSDSLLFVVWIYLSVINLVYIWLSVIVHHDRFKWSIPAPDQELIFVEPDAGELHPNESSVRDRVPHIVYLSRW